MSSPDRALIIAAALLGAAVFLALVAVAMLAHRGLLALIRWVEIRSEVREAERVLELMEVWGLTVDEALERRRASAARLPRAPGAGKLRTP